MISKEKRCDLIQHCQDGTDEVNCTCREHLLHQNSDAICDGIIDCIDESDEQNCGKK